MLVFNIVLVLMIIGAIIAMEIKDLLSSVIALGAVGMGLSLQFLLLKAPDLAITQLVVEILVLVILIRATIGRNIEKEYPKNKFRYLISGLIFLILFLWFGIKALNDLPKFGSALMNMGSRYIAEAKDKTSAVNVVSAIILDFRGYDTLGEVTILFASVLGVLSVLRMTKVKKRIDK
ncbi:MAG: DUF4040 domain-containing protein [Candidatus Omnitrophica bacterium]|nr:DUF4040 domain-containing protein [Candidatus Omnitrophota bacterium]